MVGRYVGREIFPLIQLTKVNVTALIFKLAIHRFIGESRHVSRRRPSRRSLGFRHFYGQGGQPVVTGGRELQTALPKAKRRRRPSNSRLERGARF